MFTQAKSTNTTTSNEQLIEWLEKKGYIEQANSLRNGGTSLDLEGGRFGSNKNIGNTGAKDIAELLKTSTSLTELDLSWNQIGYAGAKDIAEALKANTSLTVLSLGWNQIGNAGAKDIAEALKTNTSLTMLNLKENKIGAAGAKDIAEALKTNTSLTILALWENQIRDAKIKEIEGYVQRNKDLAKENDKKAEILNAQGDSFCGKGEYDKAIEKYTAAIAISKKPLYVTNKTSAEKKYEEQQALKYNQLILAIKEGKAEEVENLVKKLNGDTLSKIYSNGETVLTWAASKGLEKVCEILIPKMSDQAINQVNNNDYTALTYAAGKGLEKVCEMLIPKMTDQAINQVANNGETALTYAAGKGLEKVCEILISKMSDQAINQVSGDGNTALSLATKNGFKNICDLLNLKTREKQLVAFRAKQEAELREKELAALKEKQQAAAENLEKKANVQDLAQAPQTATIEEDIYQILEKIISNLQNSTNINETDKYIMENNIYKIYDKVQKLTDKNDLKNITKSMKELIVGKITKGKIVDLEEEVNEMAEKQAQIEENIRIKKLNIFKEIVTEITTKLETANIKDNAVIQKQINEIASKVQTLKDNANIEQITNSMKRLIVGKITKGTVLDLQDEVDTIRLQERNEAASIITFIVKEIIYDKPLLNHPELLGAALKKFSLKEIGERIDELSPRLIDAAINSEEGELIILGGLMSLEYNEAPTG